MQRRLVRLRHKKQIGSTEVREIETRILGFSSTEKVREVKEAAAVMVLTIWRYLVMMAKLFIEST